MPISVTCDCGRTIAAKDELAGRRVKCPQCGQPLSVPGGTPRAAGPRVQGGSAAGSGSIHDLSSGSFDLGSMAGMQPQGNPLGSPLGMPGHTGMPDMGQMGMGMPGQMGMPGMGMPGMGQPGFGQDALGGMPGMGMPGMGQAGMGMPGMGMPGMGMPGMGMPGAGYQQSGSGGGGSNTLLYVLMGLGGFTVFVLLCFVVGSMFLGGDAPVAASSPNSAVAAVPAVVEPEVPPATTPPADGATTTATPSGTGATGGAATATTPPAVGAGNAGTPAAGASAGVVATPAGAATPSGPGTAGVGGGTTPAGNAPAASGENATATPGQGPPLLALNEALTKWRGGAGPLKGLREFEGYKRAYCWSWMTDLLPHLGHQAEFDKIDFTKSWAHQEKSSLPLLEIPAFLSPGDTRTKWEGYPFEGLAMTHFVGMAGAGDSRTVSVPEIPRTDPAAGIFGYHEIMKWDDITDGTSQTIAVIGAGSLVGPWICGGGATVRGAHQPYFDKDRGFGSRGLDQPGTYVLLADGSVRVLPPDIDPKVFRAMCTGHGGDTVDVSNIGTSVTVATPESPAATPASPAATP